MVITRGLVGGIAGGIDAVRDGRKFFTGAKVEKVFDYKLPNGDLPVHLQADKTVGCTQETLESMADYKGINFQLDISQGADFSLLAKDNCFNVSATPNNPHLVGRQLLQGNPSAITYNNAGVQHTVGISRISVFQRISISGKISFRNVIRVMDPLTGYDKLPASSFATGVIRTLYGYLP